MNIVISIRDCTSYFDLQFIRTKVDTQQTSNFQLLPASSGFVVVSLMVGPSLVVGAAVGPT